MENLKGYTTKTIQRGLCTIHIHRPELEPSERTKRERQARETLENSLRDYIKRKENEK